MSQKLWRLLPDGWEEFFDPLLAATVNQTLPVSNFGMRSDRIITYNLCFGCMSGDLTIAAKDKTGAEFCQDCAEPQNMIDLDGKPCPSKTSCIQSEFVGS
jgi:hypothetical protein